MYSNYRSQSIISYSEAAPTSIHIEKVAVFYLSKTEKLKVIHLFIEPADNSTQLNITMAANVSKELHQDPCGILKVCQSYSYPDQFVIVFDDLNKI